jgi:hypothetical protein
MGLSDLFRRWFGGPGSGRAVDELARRLGVSVEEMRNIPVVYREFSIPKRSGGTRTISAPEPALKAMQRRILRRLLARLPSHPACKGFERGESIATNALVHSQKKIVLRMDLKDFFASTTARRLREYFTAIGWNREASDLLARLCTQRGGLPQGAPTSPRLSNLLNYRLDARLAGMAEKEGAAYTRYADDITFSFETGNAALRRVIQVTRLVVEEEGYRLHTRRKLHVRRPHHRQIVTGLVVNAGVRLPRSTRRRLRAAAHHLATNRPATLTAAQLQGWRALARMVAVQGQTPGAGTTDDRR